VKTLYFKPLTSAMSTVRMIELPVGLGKTILRSILVRIMNLLSWLLEYLIDHELWISSRIVSCLQTSLVRSALCYRLYELDRNKSGQEPMSSQPTA